MMSHPNLREATRYYRTLRRHIERFITMGLQWGHAEIGVATDPAVAALRDQDGLQWGHAEIGVET